MRVLKIALLVCLVPLSTYAQAIESIHIAELPLWTSTEETRWLTPSKFPSTSDGALPSLRYNTKKMNTQIDLRYGGPDLPLIKNWTLHSSPEQGCLKYRIVLKNGDKTVSFLTSKNRNSGFLDRRLSCLGGSASIYNAYYLNSQYIAFNTSEPGWVFFDHKNGGFLPFVLETNPNHHSHLFITNTGRVLVEIQENSQGKTNSTGIDRKADGLREVVLGGKNLEAPFDEKDYLTLQERARVFSCYIETKNGRHCD